MQKLVATICLIHLPSYTWWGWLTAARVWGNRRQTDRANPILSAMPRSSFFIPITEINNKNPYNLRTIRHWENFLSKLFLKQHQIIEKILNVRFSQNWMFKVKKVWKTLCSYQIYSTRIKRGTQQITMKLLHWQWHKFSSPKWIKKVRFRLVVHTFLVPTKSLQYHTMTQLS